MYLTSGFLSGRERSDKPITQRSDRDPEKAQSHQGPNGGGRLDLLVGLSVFVLGSRVVAVDSTRA